ncbi:hypothetical protein QFZ47_005681 [Variovorax paradoxus]|nr:hypothetical protein [Variovorax paradoxus]
MESSYTIGKGKLTHPPAGARHIFCEGPEKAGPPAPLSEVMDDQEE